MASGARATAPSKTRRRHKHGHHESVIRSGILVDGGGRRAGRTVALRRCDARGETRYNEFGHSRPRNRGSECTGQKDHPLATKRSRPWRSHRMRDRVRRVLIVLTQPCQKHAARSGRHQAGAKRGEQASPTTPANSVRDQQARKPEREGWPDARNECWGPRKYQNAPPARVQHNRHVIALTVLIDAIGATRIVLAFERGVTDGAKRKAELSSPRINPSPKWQGELGPLPTGLDGVAG